MSKEQERKDDIDKQITSEEIDRKMRADAQIEKERLIERLREKYKQHSDSKASGIFGTKKRQQLLGLFKPKKKRTEEEEAQAEATFWWRTRNQVRTSLTDLALFVETADEEVNKVLTAESLKPIVDSLLGSPQVSLEKPSRNKAEIARLFIAKGFEYLRSKGGMLAGSELCVRALNDALGVTDLLVETFKGGEKK